MKWPGYNPDLCQALVSDMKLGYGWEDAWRRYKMVIPESRLEFRKRYMLFAALHQAYKTTERNNARNKSDGANTASRVVSLLPDLRGRD